MSVQFPTLSDAQQKTRVDKIAQETLYPYSFSFYGSMTAATLPKIANGFISTLNYTTLGWQADNNLAISVIEVNYSVTWTAPAVGPIFTGNLLEISYISTVDPNIMSLTATLPPVPTTPTDIGNLIYRSYQQSIAVQTGGTNLATPINVTDIRRFEPYNYLVKNNQIVYIHIGAEHTALVNDPAGFYINGSVIFHTLPTGLKT